MNDFSKEYYIDNNPEWPDENKMLSKLLSDDVLFCNTRKHLDYDDKTVCEPTIVLFVNCNDVFVWGGADAESITTEELPKLFDLYMQNPTCGPIQWVCLKRNEKPQNPIVEYLKERDGWTSELESLPENLYDKMMREKYKNDNP